MRKNFLLPACLFLSPIILSAQVYLKANEKRLYSFATEDNKTVTLALDTIENTMYYRLNNPGSLNLEVHDELNAPARFFTYRHSMHADDPAVESGESNYLDFANGNFKYTIYEETVKSKINIGVRSTNVKTNSKGNQKGILKSRKGALADFKTNGLLPVNEGK